MATRKTKDFDDGYKGIFEDTNAKLTMTGKPKKANIKAAKDLKRMLAEEKKKPRAKKTTKK